MTIANAFRLPALAIIASTQVTHLDVVPAFRVNDASRENASEILSAPVPQLPDLTPAETALQHRAAERPAAAGAAESIDIWDRLRAGFGITNADDSSVQTHIETFRKHAHFIELILRRSDPYLFYILTRVEERGLPAELALLIPSRVRLPVRSESGNSCRPPPMKSGCAGTGGLTVAGT